MARLFFSYSHADEALRDELEKQLSMLRHQGLIEVWHDRRIVAGDNIDEAIDAELNSAHIILFLVSSDFLASKYCYDIEVKEAMKRHGRGEARVIPVILRPCDWHGAPFGKLMAAPKDGRAVTTWANRDEAFLDVTKSIRAAVEQSFPNAGGDGELAKPRAIPIVPPAPRSSNLRLAKKFSDFDRDQFLRETFDYVAAFFENSLNELQGRNPQVQIKYRRIDADRFVAAAYLIGSRATGCTVFVGGPGGNGIGYSSREDGETNAFNESLSVENDEQSLFLRPLGMSMQGVMPGNDAKLTQEGAAELFWAIFMRPIQPRH